jgi:molybdopterin/thiamine biosynthesis adenylyltransferase
MALADYFNRAAVAAAQVLQGFDEEMLRQRLQAHIVGVAVGGRADTPEGHALADITIRLLARLYPHLVVSAPARWRDELIERAQRVNPRITIDDSEPDIALIIGDGQMNPTRQRIYVGSDGWEALVSTSRACSVGASLLPFGAGAAGCIAAANVFRAIFLDDPRLDDDLRLGTIPMLRDADRRMPAHEVDVGRVVLAGAGAIGNATVWALGRAQVTGELHIVDHQKIELGNIQRYLLAARADEKTVKANHLAAQLTNRLVGVAHEHTWQEFAARAERPLDRVLVGLDSARDRRAVQAALPRWIANGWTQAGDLGVSIHPSFLQGACLACLYLPAGAAPNEDELIAQALGVDHQTWGLQIRNLLHGGEPVPPDLLSAAANSLGVSADAMKPFHGRSLRNLYIEGVCGGAVIPLDQLGVPAADLHVPIAHQSALAGVLVAAQLVADASGQPAGRTQITRIDLLRPIGTDLTQPAAKDPRGICICSDPVYANAYKRKHGHLRVVSA